MTAPVADFEPLRAALAGTLTTPAEGGWDDARQAWNLAMDQHPAAVVRAASAADVAASVDFARERGLRVAVQGTGHGAGTLGSLEGRCVTGYTLGGGIGRCRWTRIERA